MCDIDAELSGVAEGPEDEEDGEQPLCRLRHLGDDDRWEFAFYSWSRGLQGGYEPSYLNNGQPSGTPEQCFDCAAFHVDAQLVCNLAVVEAKVCLEDISRR